MRPISHVRIDFHTAVHWAGVKNENVLGGPVQPLARYAEYTVVLTQRRDIAGLHPFQLETQNVECLGPLDSLFDAVEHLHAKIVHRVRQERWRSAHRDFRTHLREAPDVAPSHTRIEKV